MSSDWTVVRRAAWHFLAISILVMEVARSQPDPAPVAATDSQISAGKEIYKSKGSCAFCHGWAGDGQGDPHSAGNAANLRRTHLSGEQLREVIACGRPGTDMPHFDAFAYTEDPCFGIDRAAAAPVIPPSPPRPLQTREVAAVVDYLIAKVIGKAQPTREECVDFFSESGSCNDYPERRPGGTGEQSPRKH